MKSRVVSIVVLLVISVSPIRATTITVLNTDDAGPGSLRAALAGVSDGDTIDASGVTGTVTLLSGVLNVTNGVNIIGPGPSYLAVDGDRSDRVFHITASNTVTISSLTISNGAAGPFISSAGSGIVVDGSTVTVSNCVVTLNSNDNGGGIVNNGTLTVVASTVSSNTITGLNGAGIENNGTLTVIASTISDNSGAEDGGGIYNDGWAASANLTIIASTISGNSAGLFGGGIRNVVRFGGSAMLTIRTSTVSGNSANSTGGGIFSDAQVGGTATVMIVASTFSSNSAGFAGGGIANEGDSESTATLEIGDTILDDNGLGNIFSGGGTILSEGYNLSSDSAGGDSTTGPGGLLSGTGDIRNTDPGLGPLQANGGPTFTQALAPCSPAIGQGNRDAIPALALNVDQRGLPRPAGGSTITNTTGGDGSDIGAFELQAGVNCPSITVSPGSLPDGTPGVAYEQTISASGSAATPLCFLVSSGALPAGLGLSSAGVISGVPCARGASQFTIRAADTNNCTGSLAYTVTINPASEDCADLTGVWSNLVQACSYDENGDPVHCTVRGTLIVQNIGGAKAPSSLTRYYLSSSSQLDTGSVRLKQQGTGVVEPNKPRKLNLSAKLPRGTSASGQYIIAVIDADNTVGECNVCNNTIVFGPVP